MSGDCLQQEFYQLAQDKNEKVRQFTGRLEQKYKYLKEKFPDQYQTKDLKDRLFHGMNLHICESMRFLYKKPEVTYEELLSETLEAEKDCCPSKSMTAKSKAAVVESEASPSLQKLTQEINALTTVVKSASMGTPKTKPPNHKTKINSLKSNGNKDSKTNGNSPRKGKGLTASAAGPFKPRQKSLQCYKCGGWGHTYKECPSQGGFQLEWLNQGHTTSREGEGPRDTQTKLNDQGILQRGEEKYYNPDPLYRLIGRVNEAKVKIDGCKVTGLIDLGANISSILKSFADKSGYTEVNFQVLGVKALNEDILVVIQNDSAYSSRVPITLGTLHIDMVIEMWSHHLWHHT